MQRMTGHRRCAALWLLLGWLGGAPVTPSPVAAQEAASGPEYQKVGIRDNLPVFLDRLKARQTFPMSWNSGNYFDFAAWRSMARKRVMEAFLSPPPPVPFNPLVLDELDRGTHTARKVVFNVSGDSRVLALMTVPKGPGPFPAILLLHDHGGKFDIGKEKVIEPWGEPVERHASARDWVDGERNGSRRYAGRFLGDELAARGYVCLAIDMFNWGDRGVVEHGNQQALAANFFRLGSSWAGLIIRNDLRTAEFLARQPEVDPSRIAAMGLSVGSWRTWHVAALSDRIKAGVAICWMATVHGVIAPGVHSTDGHSAYSMMHPGLHNDLDFPDVASLACPKPMLFYNGLQDGLFPVPSVREAYRKMRAVWESQGAGDKLVTRLWDVPHVFNHEMQETAFAWLDGLMKR